MRHFALEFTAILTQEREVVMWKEIFKGVAVAVLAAIILGFASRVSGTMVIKWLGGVPREEFEDFKKKAIQGQDTIAVRTLSGAYFSVSPAAKFGLVGVVAHNHSSYEMFIVERQPNNEKNLN